MAECNTGTKSKLKVYTGNVRQGGDGWWYYDFSMYIYSGDPATYSGGVGWSANASGVGNSGSVAINGSRDYLLWSGTRGPFGWDGNGNTPAQGNSLHMNASGTSGLGGPADCGETVYFPRVGAAPGQVGGVGANSITPTQANIYWSTPSRGHADINNYDLHVCDNTNFNGSGCPHYNWIGSTATSKVVTGLNPGTTYYVRVRAQNGDGAGAWSGTYSFTTLPSTPPSVAVSPSPAGGAATVVLTPPGGVSGVNSYTVTATYIAPAPVPNPATLTFTTTTNSLVATGLVAGATYAWSATATIGSYTSPASAPVQVVQPKPNTSPGDYFDGNTSDTGDIDYAWTGTADLSTSTATGVGVDGWAVAEVPSGGAASLYRTTGGYAGAYSAVALITRGTGTAGFRFGQANLAGKRTDVEVGAMYVGSLHVSPSRQQLLVAELTWITAAGALVSRSLGNAQLAPASVWTRLIVADTAPATAEYGLIRVVDVTGDGWAAWTAGESVDIDAAMISLGSVFPYFDGDTADTASYAYAWMGAANASISERSPITVVSDPLNDPDCVDVPPAPRPPTVPSDCIQDIGLWRRYWVYIPASVVSDWLTSVPSLILQTYGAPERQVRIRYYADPFNRPASAVNTDDFCSEQIVSYIPPYTELTLDGMTERVWASVQGGGTLSGDHLLYGSNGTPSQWPHLSCGIGYWVSLDVPNEAPAGNITVRARLTQRV